jgi:hypothetical protein
VRSQQSLVWSRLIWFPGTSIMSEKSIPTFIIRAVWTRSIFYVSSSRKWNVAQMLRSTSSIVAFTF